MRLLSLTTLTLLVPLIACEGPAGRSSLVKTSVEAPGPRCELGGVRIDTGFDDNGNRQLDPREVIDSQFVCNIRADGRQSLVRIVPVAAGASGPCGMAEGSRVLTGIDDNDNGALDENEVTATALICGGEDGDTTLVRARQLAPNPNAGAGQCLFGGLEITSGLDLDGDGELDQNEVEETALVCSIHVNENMTLVDQALELPGANCEFGGIKWTVGYDANGNKVLDPEEAGPPGYVCSELTVVDGVTTLLDVENATGNQCAFGGYVLRSGLDSDRDGTLDGNEVSDTSVVCNGNNGKNSIVKQVAATNQCGADGGFVVTSGLDMNNNGQLDVSEVQATGVVCNGTDGIIGVDGKNSLIRMRNVTTECGPTAGFILEIGLDDNRNNVLDPGEVDDWDVVCDGLDGYDSAIYIEEDNSFCLYGGVRVETGLDLDFDGILDENEATHISYICDGAQGFSGLVDVEPAGNACPIDGVWFLTGLDLDEDGFLDEDEIDNELLVCF